MTEKTGRNRRSILNIQFMKGAKLRLVFATMTGGMILSAVMILSVMGVVERSLAHVPANDPALRNLLDAVGREVNNALAVGLVCTAASALNALLFGLLVSHRFFGPIVALTRHLRELRDGRFGARANLRPGDELGELMQAQNELADSLEKRYGKT